jgi:hypothetical protein
LAPLFALFENPLLPRLNLVLLDPSCHDRVLGGALSLTARASGARVWPPVWSRQHGATILLAVSWLIAVATTPHLSLVQPALLVALLSGFHAVEIALAGLRRKGLANARQRLWLGIYTVAAALSAMTAVHLAPALTDRAPWVATIVTAAVLVGLAGATKRGLGELVLFGALSAAGFLAYRPELPPSAVLREAIPLWLLTWWYFALSIALVKYRLGRTSGRAAALSTVVAAGATAALGRGTLSTLVPALILVKGAVWWIAAHRLRAMPLPALGLLETAAALAFALLLSVAARTGP